MRRKSEAVLLLIKVCLTDANLRKLIAKFRCSKPEIVAARGKRLTAVLSTAD